MQELSKLQHFAEIGRVSASLLHEISNPLAAAILELDQHPDTQAQGVQQARQNLRRLRNYVESARQQVRHDGPRMHFSLRPQVQQIRQLVAPVARAARVNLQVSGVPVCRLFGDPVKFQQILVNLIINAIEAYRNDSDHGLARPIELSFTATSSELVVTITDWGEGISPQQLAHIFEPFYSTKTAENKYGMGIGLALVRHYVDDLGGAITVSSSARLGTRFTITLPFAPTT